MKIKLLLALAALLAIPGKSDAAGAFTAIVEQATGTEAIQQMELLERGRTIKLKKGSVIVLGYLNSCIRETITGGTVTIGAKRSRVENGDLKSEQVNCDAGRIVSAGKKADDVAGIVFRKGDFRNKIVPKPDWVLFGVSPIVRLSKAASNIKIERLDKTEKSVTVPVKGDWVDLAAAGVRLKPSGTYAITTGSRPYIIKVSPLAEPGAPVLSRLIVM